MDLDLDTEDDNMARFIGQFFWIVSNYEASGYRLIDVIRSGEFQLTGKVKIAYDNLDQTLPKTQGLADLPFSEALALLCNC